MSNQQRSHLMSVRARRLFVKVSQSKKVVCEGRIISILTIPGGSSPLHRGGMDQLIILPFSDTL